MKMSPKFRVINILITVIAPLSLSIGNLATAKPREYYTQPENVVLNRPFSEAVRVGKTLYLSGQIGIAPGDTRLVPGGIIPETEQIMKNIEKILEYFKLRYSDIIKCQAMLRDIKEWNKFNSIYTSYFSKPFPARSAFGSTGLAFAARVELECMAHIPD